MILVNAYTWIDNIHFISKTNDGNFHGFFLSITFTTWGDKLSRVEFFFSQKNICRMNKTALKHRMDIATARSDCEWCLFVWRIFSKPKNWCIFCYFISFHSLRSICAHVHTHALRHESFSRSYMRLKMSISSFMIGVCVEIVVCLWMYECCLSLRQCVRTLFSIESETVFVRSFVRTFVNLRS